MVNSAFGSIYTAEHFAATFCVFWEQEKGRIPQICVEFIARELTPCLVQLHNEAQRARRAGYVNDYGGRATNLNPISSYILRTEIEQLRRTLELLEDIYQMYKDTII